MRIFTMDTGSQLIIRTFGGLLLLLNGCVSLSCLTGEYPVYVPNGRVLLDLSNLSGSAKTGASNEIQCQMRCDDLTEFICQSFSYNSVTSVCWMYPVTSRDVGVMTIDEPAAQHYDGICSETPNLANCDVTNDQVDLAFLVDGSGSICDKDPTKDDTDEINRCNNWRKLKNFIKQTISLLKIGPQDTRIALVTFANEGKVEFDFNRYDTRSKIESAVDNLAHPGGNTNTYDGLLLAQRDIFTGVAGRTEIAFVITDGFPTINKNETDDLALDLQETIIMYSVGITENIDEYWLQTLSSTPHVLNQNYFKSTNFDYLLPVIGKLLSAACIKLDQPTTEPETSAEPSSEPEPEMSMDDVFNYFKHHPEYIAMIGMGFMIVLLFITAIVILCCYTGAAARKRSDDYREKA